MLSDYRVFELYKPLRNHLRKVCLEDSLFVMWAYVQNLQFNFPIPKEIEVDPKISQKKHPAEKGIYAWEIELLTKEIIINSQVGENCSDSLKQWSFLARTINNLKTLEDTICKLYVNKKNILSELHRIAHRQFPWQDTFFKGQLIRYYKIFNHPSINKIAQDKIGLSIYGLYFISYALSSLYLKHPAINYPIDISIHEINPQNIDNFLNCFSKELSEIKKLIEKEQEFNDKYAYSYSSLRAYPIIRMQYGGELNIVCPLPTLLLWRITGGLYYELLTTDDFSTFWGESFQNFIGEIIAKCNSNENIKYIPEHEYYVGKNRKDTADWIVYDLNSALFIECKTKRMTIPAKIELIDTDPIMAELEKMSQFILQIYKTIEDYRNKLYPNFAFNKNIQIFPLIVTLEDWYLFGDIMLSNLKDMVKGKLKDSGLPSSLLDEMPYSICSVEEFEELMPIIQQTGINNLMREKVFNQEESKWNFKTFVRSKYMKEIENLTYPFENDYKVLFEQFISGLRYP